MALLLEQGTFGAIYENQNKKNLDGSGACNAAARA